MVSDCSRSSRAAPCLVGPRQLRHRRAAAATPAGRADAASPCYLPNGPVVPLGRKSDVQAINIIWVPGTQPPKQRAVGSLPRAAAGWRLPPVPP